jgi:hypothetical protein
LIRFRKKNKKKDLLRITSFKILLENNMNTNEDDISAKKINSAI